jgi:hypothetical protein
VFIPGSQAAAAVSRVPGMTTDMAIAIYIYTMESLDAAVPLYRDFNCALRGSDVHGHITCDRTYLRRHYFPYLRLFMAACRALKSIQGTEQLTLNRAVNLNLAERYPQYYFKGRRDRPPRAVLRVARSLLRGREHADSLGSDEHVDCGEARCARTLPESWP